MPPPFTDCSGPVGRGEPRPSPWKRRSLSLILLPFACLVGYYLGALPLARLTQRGIRPEIEAINGLYIDPNSLDFGDVWETTRYPLTLQEKRRQSASNHHQILRVMRVRIIVRKPDKQTELLTVEVRYYGQVPASGNLSEPASRPVKKGKPSAAGSPSLRSCRMRYSSYCLAAVIMWLASHQVFAQAPGKQPVLEKIFADWKERQGLVKTARYVITGTTEFKDKELPPGNPVRPRRSALLLDIERKRWRLETSQELKDYMGGKGLRYSPRFSTTAFDGEAMQCYYHRDLNHTEDGGPDLGIERGQLYRGGPFDMHLYPVFFAHGIVATAQDTQLRQHDLPTSYDPEYFEIRGRLSFRGHSCTVLRTMPILAGEPFYNEVWIDLSEKSAIQRYIDFVGKNPSSVLEVDWKQSPELGWRPVRWTLTWTINGRVQSIHRLQVESFEANATAADADFTLEAKPGMRVVVADSPPPGPGLNPDLVPTRTYLVSPSGSWQEISAKGVHHSRRRSAPVRAELDTDLVDSGRRLSSCRHWFPVLPSTPQAQAVVGKWPMIDWLETTSEISEL